MILKNGKIITGNGGVIQGDILIKEDIIFEIGELENDNFKEKIIDLNNKTVIPGLIDCHTHLGLGGSKEVNISEDKYKSICGKFLRAMINAQATLAAGFTTVRDVGGVPDFGDVTLRDAFNEGILPGPRLLVSGGGLTMTGGHGWNSLAPGIIEVDGITEARKAARKQLKHNVDVIKIMASKAGSAKNAPGAPEFTIKEMKAICDEAHKAGVKCTSHAISAQSIKNAIQAGIDSIDHGCLVDDETLDLMMENGVSLISTIWVYLCQFERGQQLKGYPDFRVKRSKEINDVYSKNIRKALAKGVKVGLGSDCGLDVTPHGENASELIQMVKFAGISEMEAIILATKSNSEILGLEKQIGTVEEGKIADLVVIDGDPLKDLSCLLEKENIDLVIKNGEIMTGPGSGI